jgi:hypothetical protein
MKAFFDPAGSRARRVLMSGFTSLLLALAPAAGRAAEAVVPAPGQLFTPNSSFVLYMDLAAASRTAIWKAMESEFKDLPGQLSSNLPGGVPGFPTDLPIVRMLENLDLAELAMVGEGPLDMAALESGRVDKDAGFALAVRLSGIVPDQEAFVAQLLQLLEQEHAGLSDRVASTRSREGAADLFTLPPEALGNQQFPFGMSAAVGPGKGGTVLALGRTELLKAFVLGQRGGAVPTQVNTLLPSRGQIWLYAPIPAEAAQGLVSAGGAGLQGNPMMAGLTKSLGQLDGFALAASFGTTAMDLEIALGCKTAAAARELADGLQGMLGMVQMMAAQNPSTPGFLTRMKAEASGVRFAVRTSINAKDLQLMRSAAGAAAGRSAPPSSTSGRGTVVVTPLAEPSAAPVELEFLNLLPDQGGHVRRGRLQVRNSSSRPVKEIRVTFQYRDSRGALLGEWTRVQRDLYTDTLIAGSSNRTIEVSLFNVPFRTEQVTAILLELEFIDGEKWTAKR